LATLGTAHELLHLSSATKGIEGGAVSSITLRGEIREIANLIGEVAEMKPDGVRQIMSLMTFDGVAPAMASLGQLLICPNGHEVLIPRAYSKGLRWERNILKWIARNPATKRQYDSFSVQKEGIALPIILAAIRNEYVTARSTVGISNAGKIATDVDILAFDRRDGCLLIIQHKWLIEPDTVNESKAADAELEKGIEQARIAKTRLVDLDYSRQLMKEIPEEGYSRVEAIVVCKGMEPTGFVTETDVPVVTERWLMEQLPGCLGLGKLYDLARQRPDRKQLAKEWQKDS
jgi:hypothetical protein